MDAGLHLTLKTPDKAGLMIELSRAVLGLGDHIVGLSSSCDEAIRDHRFIIKGEEIDKKRIVALLASLGYRAM